ncbi:uncharacterized protein LOC134668303 [Cydia fagiglandana]|uniref:uncharacterized protein LOC134668303 n=1 Tax=Cydia fagiglandana TaxID=1458189 RepID=UPI002FEE32AB
MFWSGNYIAVRELNSLLKEENVTLSQVLEADDVLQECKADNKALIQFLTRPDILAELVTLITEEPPKNVELSLQYRHASIACEVLTSQLPTLSDRLSMDTVQMHRLCDFINREPPLNPLLASYFSKTIEMLLDRSPKQDWYLYHIVCLRVLDFLKARRDFLPNLLRHLHTSAVLDALKCFIRLNDLFNKLIMEWLEEHQFLEALIAIICGTYEPPPLAPRAPPCELEKGQQEESEKAEKEAVEKGDLDAQDKEVREGLPTSEQATGDNAQAEAEAEAKAERAAERVRAIAAANAAALLTDIILNGCAADYSQVSPAGNTRSRTAQALVARVTSPRGVGALLQGVFTSPGPARRHALVHGARLLLAMREDQDYNAEQGGSGGASTRNGVELAVAPHLPLLHTALLQPPEPYMHEPSSWEAPTDGGGGTAVSAAGDAAVTTEVPAPERGDPAPLSEATAPHEATPPHEAPAPLAEANVKPAEPSEGSTEATAEAKETSATEVPTEAPKPPPAPRVAVGAARLQVAALLAALCGSEVDEVASTMLTLGTPGVLIDMFFAHPHNNFLHAQVMVMVRNALTNRAYRTQYARHILDECDLFNRLMDIYEENETNRGTASSPRAGYMGHVVRLLRTIAPTLEERTPAAERWAASSIESLIKQLDTPLGYGEQPRAGYMGHVVRLLRTIAPTLEERTPAAERWAASSIESLIKQLDTPLGYCEQPRAGYMGHVVRLLRTIAPTLEERTPAAERWAASSIESLIKQLDTPLGYGEQPRAGYMGHVVRLLRTIAPTLEERTPAAERWAASSIESLIKQLDTPLGYGEQPRAGYMGHVVRLLRTIAPTLEERIPAAERWAASSIELLIKQLDTPLGYGEQPRAGYMGHVVRLLRTIAPTLEERTPAAERLAASSIESLIKQLDTPLGGYYPSDNTYEVEPEGMVEVETRLYNLSNVSNTNYSDFATDEDLSEVASSANMNKFLELSNQRMCDQSDMWDDAPEGEAEEERDRDREDDAGEKDDDDGEARATVHDVLAPVSPVSIQCGREGDRDRVDDAGEKDDDDGEARATVHDVLAPVSPWESSFEESNMAGEGWAQFSADAFGAPIDPFANTDAFAKSDAFANDAFAKSDAFANDAFEKDAFASAAFKKEFDAWRYQDKGDDVNGTSGVEQSLHDLRLDAMDKPLDELSSSLADNLRTAMSSMTPEVIANIVNANMTPALDVPLDVPNASNPTDASNASNTKETSSTSSTPSTANEPSNTPSESEKVSDNDSKDQNQVQDPSES